MFFDGDPYSCTLPYVATSALALITPTNLGATAITFKASIAPDGTFIDVNDETGAKITVTVHTSNAGWADLTNIFPASVRFVKIVSGTSLANAKDITLATLAVASPKQGS